MSEEELREEAAGKTRKLQEKREKSWEHKGTPYLTMRGWMKVRARV